MDLTEDDVLQILNLIEKSHFDFLELDLGDLKLTVSKGGVDFRPQDRAVGEKSSERATSSTETGESREHQKETKSESRESRSPASTADDTVPITAPVVGTFYVAPEPGAPPYVQEGGGVEEESTVGLIEVMKVFNAVTAGVQGVVAEICVQNGQFVEFGQTLFRIKPK